MSHDRAFFQCWYSLEGLFRTKWTSNQRLWTKFSNDEEIKTLFIDLLLTIDSVI